MAANASESAAATLRWLVGVDARDLSAGAVAFAGWMATRAPQDRFLALHVLEESWREHLARIREAPGGGDVEAAADAIVEPLRRDERFSGVRTFASPTAVEGLTAELAARRCDALVVGRRKPADRNVLVRLGRVARRLLRVLPCPVVVVPPDLRVDTLQPGPILLGTDLGVSSAGAAAFASAMAASLDLDMLVTHVVSIPDEIPRFMPDTRWASPLDASRASRADALAQWVAARGLSDARTSVVDGPPAATLQEVAKIAGASMVVVGSRALAVSDRFVVSSVGSELAANAPIPVAVVPASWERNA